jgi:hypothetical protein
VIGPLFHAWERRLASVDQNRVVLPFDWGLEWLDLDAPARGDLVDPDHPRRTLTRWADRTLADSEAWFATAEAPDYTLERGPGHDTLRFTSAVTTPHAVNNTVMARVFHPPDRDRSPRRAVIVLPQWNADAGGHVGLCRLFARFGLTAARLTLPYHDSRRPDELARAEYIVSANVGQTLQVNRQAVLDARRVVAWFARNGFERIGIIGTSLGSCLAMLTMAHEPRIRAGAFNHVSPYFADVVWQGLSTRHVREGLEGHVDLDELRRYWMPISPWPYMDRIRDRATLLVYARYDLTFPVPLSRLFVDEFARRGISHDLCVLPCGHYSTGKTPFKFLDGYALTKFFLIKL